MHTRSRSASIALAAACVSAWVATSCSDRTEKTAPPASPNPAAVAIQPTAAQVARFPDGKTLLLAQAQFEWDTDATGKRTPRPGPAKLTMLSPTVDGWTAQILEDPDSRVFHKAICVRTPDGDRLLTIGATDAILKLWRVDSGAWRSEKVWQTKFGGTWDRLRDVQIGDVDDDGQPELVVVTHDQGVVAVIDRKGSEWKVEEVYRSPNTFIHEVQIGDVDGDRRTEFYVTPSQPNKADVSQPGSVLAFRFQAGKGYQATEVTRFVGSHAKEILVADINADGRPELYAAVEAARGNAGKEPVQVRQLYLTGGNKWKSRLVAELPDAVQSRFLVPADLTSSGRLEIVATTMKDGIWRLIPAKPADRPWATVQIDDDSSSFEHAAGVADLDNDGKPELYVSADDQDEVRQYRWNGQSFDRQVIHRLAASDLTWNLLACSPIAL